MLNSAKVPLLQTKHSMAPCKAATVPGRQSRHLSCWAKGWYVPWSQMAQATEAGFSA